MAPFQKVAKKDSNKHGAQTTTALRSITHNDRSNNETRRPSPSSSTLQQHHLTDEAPSDDFFARRSPRVAAGRFVADNDTWVEALAVCELPSNNRRGGDSSKRGGGLLSKFKSKSNHSSSNSNANNENKFTANIHHNDMNLTSTTEVELAQAAQRLTLRPYFQSQNTGQRVWDEPPSGASKIVYATAEARKMAQAQLEEMRATYAYDAMARRAEKEEKETLKGRMKRMERENSGGKGGLSLLKRNFRVSGSTSLSGNAAATADVGAQSSSSTPLVASSNSDNAADAFNDSDNRQKARNLQSGIPSSILIESASLANDGSYERDLQIAMLMSMGIGGGSVMGVGGQTGAKGSSSSRRSPDTLTREEQEQLAIATALSLSEEEARRSRSVGQRSRSSSRSSSTNGSRSRQRGSVSRERAETRLPASSKNGASQSVAPSQSHGVKTTSSKPPLVQPPRKMPPPSISSSSYSNSNYKDDGFDGGGKIPATNHHPRAKNQRKSDKQSGFAEFDTAFGNAVDGRGVVGGGSRSPARDSAASTSTASGGLASGGGSGKSTADRETCRDYDFCNKGPSWELEWAQEEVKTNNNAGSSSRKIADDKYPQAMLEKMSRQHG